MTYSEEPGLCTDRAYGSEACCPSSHPRGYVCTRIDGHGGEHEAGVGRTYVATWGDEDEAVLPVFAR